MDRSRDYLYTQLNKFNMEVSKLVIAGNNRADKMEQKIKNMESNIELIL